MSVQHISTTFEIHQYRRNSKNVPTFPLNKLFTNNPNYTIKKGKAFLVSTLSETPRNPLYDLLLSRENKSLPVTTDRVASIEMRRNGQKNIKERVSEYHCSTKAGRQTE